MKRKVSKKPSLQTNFTEITEEARLRECSLIERLKISFLRSTNCYWNVKGRGIRVQRERVRTIVRRIDPIGVPYNRRKLRPRPHECVFKSLRFHFTENAMKVLRPHHRF